MALNGQKTFGKTGDTAIPQFHVYTYAYAVLSIIYGSARDNILSLVVPRTPAAFNHAEPQRRTDITNHMSGGISSGGARVIRARGQDNTLAPLASLLQ